MSTPEPPAGPSDWPWAPGTDPAPIPARRTSRSARCSPTIRRGSVTSGSTRGSARPRRESPSPPTTPHEPARDGDPAHRGRGRGRGGPGAVRRRDQRDAHRHRAGPGRARPGLRSAGPQVPRRGRRSGRPPTSARLAPWVGAGLRRLAGRGRRGQADPGRGPARDAAAAGRAVRAGVSAVLDQPGTTGPGPALAAALARPLRPGRLADHPGVLAADAAAGRPGRADRDPDLPQPATAVAAAAHRQLGQPATAVQFAVAAVRIAVAAVRIALTRSRGPRRDRPSMSGSRVRLGLPVAVGQRVRAGSAHRVGRPPPGRPPRPPPDCSATDRRGCPS